VAIACTIIGGLLGSCTSGDSSGGSSNNGASPLSPSVSVQAASTSLQESSAGSAPVGPTVITLAGHDMGPGEADEFVDEVDRLSNGSLKISLQPDLHGADLDYQEEYINDVQAGSYDMILVPARAWHLVGYHGFDPFVAPFLIESFGAEQAVLQSGLSKSALDGLAPLGVIGIGLTPGVLRHPVGIHQPVLTLADIAGKTFGVYPSPIAEQAVSAMGAVPKKIPPSFPASGLDVGEQDLAGAADILWDVNSTAITTNITLWPRMQTLVMNAASHAALTPDEQEVLQQAVVASNPAKIDALRAAEEKAVTTLCNFPYQLVQATETDRTAFIKSVQPVIATIESDPTAASEIAAIRDLAAKTPTDAIDRTCPS
jgi:TRAP-type C4-dicarboxylate transport system substrate-binding protein